MRSNATKEKSCEWKVFYTDGMLMSARLTGYGKSLAEGLYFLALPGITYITFLLIVSERVFFFLFF